MIVRYRAVSPTGSLRKGKVRQESRHGARSHCRARESPKTVADGGIVASDFPVEDPEIESYRAPQERMPRAGQGFSPSISPSRLFSRHLRTSISIVGGGVTVSAA